MMHSDVAIGALRRQYPGGCRAAEVLEAML